MILAHLGRAVRDRRGIALPMALFTLLLLTSLSIAFVTLSQTEPLIATNHMRSGQARALAEAGLERAIWALNNSTDTNGISITLNGTAAAPYDGTYKDVTGYSGGFMVTVTGSSTTPFVKSVTSLGYSPSSTATNKAKSTIIVTLSKLNNLAFDTPCGLCVNSKVTITGTAEVDARASVGSACGSKIGVSTTATTSPGMVCPRATGTDDDSGCAVRTGSAATKIYGGDAASGTANVEGEDWNAGQTFNFTLKSSDIDSIRALSKLTGNKYVQPASTTAFNLTGVSNGLVFVDTTDASNTVTSSNKASVKLQSGWGPAPFKGWLVVLGDVDLDGNFGGFEGVLYVRNSLTSSGSGTSTIRGVTVIEQILGGTSFTAGNTKFIFDCAAAQSRDAVPTGWQVKPGTYCDKPGGCS